MFLRAGAGAQGLSRVMRRLLMIMTASGAACVHQTNALRCDVLRNPRLKVRVFPARSRPKRGVAARGDPYRGEGKAPRRATFMQNSKQAQAVPQSNLDGQERPFLRQWARSALRSGRRSAWASPCAATHVPPRLSGNLGKPRRSGRRRGLRAARGVLSHRRDLISGARRRSRHRRNLISDAAEPHYTQKR